ncbi:MAG: hypothetical protein IJ669_08035 [Prevotella sp.]|nr:hypothetical protein [Prevotella sp.]
MKKLLNILFLLIVFTIDSNAQTDSVFCATITNETENISISINLYNQNIIVEGQEMLGEMAGYISADYDFRLWLIVSAEITSEDKAVLTIINDYGSEDLKAQLTFNNSNSTYTLKQLQGSTIKFAKNKKWIKLPKELQFKRVDKLTSLQ